MNNREQPPTRPAGAPEPQNARHASENRPILCSVVVPVYNGASVIGRCLDALTRQTVSPDEFEIIVVDDGSTDATAEVAARWASEHPTVALCLLRQERGGPASARNSGARAARGPLLLFTDADCRPTPGWMAALLAEFAHPDPPAGLMGSYLTDQPDLAGRFAQMEFEDRYHLMSRHRQIDLIATYSAAFQRDLFLAEEGFDPSFPNNEDVEFSYRLSEHGHRMHFVPEARVYHRHASTWLRYGQQKAGRGYWRTLVYRRHPGKAVKDTYTPQVLKLQILLAPLVVLGLLAALVTRRAAWTALAAPFLATTAPFVRFAASRDPLVALVSPWGLWIRSAAFVLGVAGGVLASLRGGPESGPPAAKDETRL